MKLCSVAHLELAHTGGISSAGNDRPKDTCRENGHQVYSMLLCQLPCGLFCKHLRLPQELVSMMLRTDQLAPFTFLMCLICLEASASSQNEVLLLHSQFSSAAIAHLAEVVTRLGICLCLIIPVFFCEELPIAGSLLDLHHSCNTARP